MNAFRAYFVLKNGLTTGASSQGAKVRAFSLNFGDDETTGVEELKDSKIEELKSYDVWYTLDGRRLEGKPTVKGLYIVNGKKVMVQ